jgi:hypothetical protein
MNRTFYAAPWVCFFLSVFLLAGCGKTNHPGSSNLNGTGTGASGPSGTWLSNMATTSQGDSIKTELQFNTDHTVKRVITLYTSTSGNAGDTSFVIILPVYSGGKLTSLQSPSDSVSVSGPITTQFIYAPSGALQKIEYGVQTSYLTYDSLVIGTDNLLSTVYHFIPAGTQGLPTLVQTSAFTWNTYQDLTQVMITSADTSSGLTSEQWATYMYDNSYNPYKTVQDLAYILGPLDNDLTMLSANDALGLFLSGHNFSDTLLYQYNPQNLPTSQNLELIQQGSLKSSTFTYFQYIGQN